MHHDNPVIAAATAGDVRQLAALLDAQPAAVNARGWMDITPLIAATSEADSAATVRLLLERGADPRAVRIHGDGALHWAASGEVARLLAAAAGPAGLAALDHADRTPLHEAVMKGYVDVVRAFLGAGPDTAVRDADGRMPLDLADEPDTAHLLITADAPVWTGQATTPLHRACQRSAAEAGWEPVAWLLLDYGADPGLRDEFGALPVDLIGEHGPRELRGRLIAALEAWGRSQERILDEFAYALTRDRGAVARGAGSGSPRQEQIAIHPHRPEALTPLFAGTVLVRWQLLPSIAPIEVIRTAGREPLWGPFSAGAGRTLAFTDRESVYLRDWDDLRQPRSIAPGLLPKRSLGAYPMPPGDGRHLLVSATEHLRLIDLDRNVVAGEADELGDWSVEARFSPDGRILAVGNSMQGSWYLTVFDVGEDGSLRERYMREDGLPGGFDYEIVTDLAFTPNGDMFATWIRPHGGYGPHNHHGWLAATWTHSGEPAWQLRVTHRVAIGEPEFGTTASLCFTPDSTHLAVGLDSGVLWVDAATGEPAGQERTTGPVTALAAHPDVGVLALTQHGLHRVEPPGPPTTNDHGQGHG